MPKFYLFTFFLFFACYSHAQLIPIERGPSFKYCYSMEAIEEAIQKNPGIINAWKLRGEAKTESFLQRKAMNRRVMNDTVVIPVVFHLVDEAERQAWINDRSVYDQVEILNEAYNGLRSDAYQNVTVKEFYQLTGRIPVKFVLAKQKPNGQPTNGIERRVATTPDRISIKSTAAGGLDPWDVTKYVNIWAGTLTGNDGGLLGVSTMPFLDTQGPDGVVINIATLPASTDISRQYYPQYSEGATLVHELGHFFYLFHAFGSENENTCTDNDFITYPGWPLTYDENADDTPPEKYGESISFGNPSQTYSSGCADPVTGEMHGNFMNYFDDRGLFMFSEGQSNRIIDCIDRYYPDIPQSQGTISLSNITDAYLVSAAPHGNQERIAFIHKDVDWSVKIRNYGGTLLNDVNLTVASEGTILLNKKINLSLEQGKDQSIALGKLNIGSGKKLIKIYTSNPNGTQDDYPGNDTIYSFVYVVDDIATTPFLENFSSNTFPPSGWLVWNPNANGTWQYNSASGFEGAGSATMQFNGITGQGQIDELVMPAISITGTDSASLTFDYAYQQRSNNPLSWDGLEIYVSNNLGKTYELIYKKTGQYLKTVDPLSATPFRALPSEPEKWRKDTVTLNSFLNGNPLLIKFRAVNEKGNNLYLDNIRIDQSKIARYDVALDEITQTPVHIYDERVTPSIKFTNKGSEPILALTLSQQVGSSSAVNKTWNGNLLSGQNSSLNMENLPSLAPGRHVITMYSTPSTQFPDKNQSNDTARFVFYQMGKSETPIEESFESGSFTDPQWVIQESPDNISWQPATGIATDGVNSAYVDNFGNDMNGGATHLFSPVITIDKTYDSLFLSFDYAYAAALKKDSLQIMVSTDEGKSFTTIFVSGGNDLATTTTGGRSGSFTPSNDEWDSMRLYLTPYMNGSPFQIVFTAIGHHGNNLYLDDIKIFGNTVPELVKEKGYLFYPSPFNDQFVIRHFETPNDLRNVRIFDAAGKLVWQQAFHNDAQRLIHVKTSEWARGVYIVRLDYTDRSVAGKVIKQ